MIARTLLAVTTFALAGTTAYADITIATVGPMTGQFASIGEQMRKGAAKAVEVINAAGGVNGEKLKLEVMDDACDPKQATQLANQIVSKNIGFVAGHFCSSSSIPAAAIYDESGVVMISPASTSPTLTDSGFTSVFRICGRDDQQGKAAADYILTHYKEAKVAVIHDKSAYGKGLADQTAAILEKGGLKPAMLEAITPGDRDFSALITRMKRENIGFMFLGGYHTEAGLIRRQATDLGLTAPLMAGDSLVTREFWTITGEAGTGTLLTFSPDPRINLEAKDIVESFRNDKYEPEGYTLYNFAVVQVLAEAMKQANSSDPAKVLPVLKKGEFPTVRGQVKFNAKGDILAPNYVVYRWEKGDYHMLPTDKPAGKKSGKK